MVANLRPRLATVYFDERSPLMLVRVPWPAHPLCSLRRSALESCLLLLAFCLLSLPTAARAAGHPTGRGHGNRPRLQLSGNELRRALTAYVPALRGGAEPAGGGQRGDADAQYESCQTYLDSEQYQKAHDSCMAALPLYVSALDKRGEASTLHALGLIHLRQGENRQALDHFEQALGLWKSLGDGDSEAATQHSLSSVYNNLGDKQKALELLNRALTLRKASRNIKGEAGALNGLGALYSDLGEYQRALDYLKLASPLAERAGDVVEQANIRNNFADVYLRLGETQKAFDYFKQAEELYKAASNKRGQATVLNNIGGVQFAMGKSREALATLNQALLIRRRAGDKQGEAATLQNIGSVHFAAGENEKALEVLEKALYLVKTACNRGGQAMILNNTALIQSKLGNYEDADVRFGVALTLTRLSGDKAGEANVMANLMGFWESVNHPRMAIFFGKQAVNTLQQMRALNVTRGIDSEFQKSFVLKSQSVYRGLAELLIREGHLEQAVEVLNLYHDQQSFDLKRDPGNPIRQLGLTARESRFARQYETASDKIGQAALQVVDIERCRRKRLNEQDAARLAKYEAEYSAGVDKVLGFYNNSRKEFAKEPDGEDVLPQVRSVGRFRETLRAVSLETKQNTVALYALTGAEHFRLLVVSPGGVKAFASHVVFDEFESKAQQFYALLRSDRYDPRAFGKELYDLILGPARKELDRQNAQTLLWSLDGRLRYVPMAALWDGEKYLVERYRNVVFTRAEPERMTRGVSRDWSGVGFGSSRARSVDVDEDGKGDVDLDPLPGMAEELRGVFKKTPIDKAGVLMGEVFTDAQFTETKFYEALRARPPVVHISSHFVFRAGDASRSFLLLGNGKPLTLHGMKNKEGLFAGVELLTLSACDTASVRADDYGKEVDGFAELAQRLGAASVMATLWKVTEGSTAGLMAGFYRGRQNQGMTKAEALRQSQLDLLYGRTGGPDSVVVKGEPADEEIVEDKYLTDFTPREGRPFEHPYYWSSFVLFGNWK